MIFYTSQNNKQIAHEDTEPSGIGYFIVCQYCI